MTLTLSDTPFTQFDLYFNPDSPLPPPFKSKTQRTYDTRSTDFCRILSSFYLHTFPCQATNAGEIQFTPTKSFLDPYIFELHYQKFTNLNQLKDNKPIYVSYSANPDHSLVFPHEYLTQDIFYCLEIFIKDLLLAIPEEDNASPDFVFPYTHTDVTTFKNSIFSPDSLNNITRIR